jgi:threonine synthase
VCPFTACFYNIVFEGKQLELSTTSDDALFIEFIGDGITVGAGLNGNACDASQAYAYLVANQLKVNYTITSFEGQGLISGTDPISTAYGKEGDFSHRADMIVVNVGSEDFALTGDDAITADTISETYKNGYLCDTHTAVAVNVYREYVKATGDTAEAVIASTANPYKFSAAVLKAVKGEIPGDADEFEQVDLLIAETGAECPSQLATLKGKEPRFTECCEKEDMIEMVYKMLGI